MSLGVSIILLFLTTFAQAQASPDPQKQTDVYIWKAPFSKPTIAPFAAVSGYRFNLTQANAALAKRVKAAVMKELPRACGQFLDPTWPIYQYSLKEDGALLAVSCRATSFDTWRAYYQLTPDNQLKLLTFQIPVLNQFSKDSNAVAPKIVAYRTASVLLNSDLLQRRMVSHRSLLQQSKQQFFGEWIWKEGHGFTLMKYAYTVYDQHNKFHETRLYP